MGKRKDIRDYPDAYIDILNHLKNGGEEVSFLLPAKEAHSTRRNLYRFFAEVRRAADDEDSYAAEFVSLVRNLKVSIPSTKTQKGHTDNLKLTVMKSTELSLGDALVGGCLPKLDSEMISEVYKKRNPVKEESFNEDKLEVTDILKEIIPTDGIEDLIKELGEVKNNYIEEEDS